MGEIKSVKVDNWGVFFLQKLQNFFNKTDYCDLTLQFRDNSQLKVHRLVLSACTDYFNVLEHTCEVVDDALIMPNELQADVVVPIVNFMYTGTLEFELKMYGKLLRTAKEMNMTVLLKLLEAHRRTMEGVNRAQRPPSPKSIRRRAVVPSGNTNVSQNQQQQQQQSSQQPTRRILTSSNTAQTQQQQQQQRRIVQTKMTATNTSSSSQQQQPAQYRQQIGSTSLLKTSVGSGGGITSPVKSQYGNVTVYETYQQQNQVKSEFGETTYQQQQQPTSPFEQLRKGYNNNKRPASATFISPPAKKPNIEDVKEFAEQQRMRKQIAAEYGDDQVGEYESMLDDDIHNDDDDDEQGGSGSANTSSTGVQASTSRQHQNMSGTTTITFKQEQNDKPPTIVVKDSSNSKMNHAKIISEVLRQYPHLVKSNKNIKLKIMPNASSGGGGGSGAGQTQKIIVKKEHLDNSDQQSQHQQQQSVKSQTTLLKPLEKTSVSQQKQTQPTMPKASATITTTGTSTAAPPAAAPAAGQKRRIDSKTMHALIALGAANTTGPWLCLRCGVNGRPISIPSYRGFRRHLINTHKEIIDPSLCEHCGWQSSNNRELHYHMQVEHKVKTTLYTFPECLMCAKLFLDTNTLNQHMIDSHPDENKQQCIYCNKIFAKEMQLYTHMKTYHKKQALEDGIIDYSDEEFIGGGSQDEGEEPQQSLMQHNLKQRKENAKIKILSDISLPSTGSLMKLEPSSEAAALSTVASGIAASIGLTNADEFMDTSESAAAATTTSVTVVETETKFVNVDGNEMILTEEQRNEIISQLSQQHGNGAGGVVMVLNEPDAAEAAPETDNATEDEIMHDETAGEDENEHDEEAEAEEQVTTAVGGRTADEIASADDEHMEEDADDDEGEIAEHNTTIGDASTATDEDLDDSHIYKEFTANDAQTNASEDDAGEVKKSTADESKESIENLEWAENLISAHELADEVEASDVAEEKSKKNDDISKKLKELTGDWSEDDNDDDDHDDDQDDEVVKAVHDIAKPKEDNNDVKEPALKLEKKEGSKIEDIKKEKSLPDTSVETATKENVQKEENKFAAADAEVNSDNEEDDEKEEENAEESTEDSKPTEDLHGDTTIDEDDIDLAMKSLHKDEEVEERGKTVVEETVEAEAPPAEDIEINNIEKENDGEDKKELEKGETVDKEEGEKFVEDEKVSGSQRETEARTLQEKRKSGEVEEKEKEVEERKAEEEIEAKAELKEDEKIMKKETDSSPTVDDVDSKLLLAELIADADSVMPIDGEEEFIAEIAKTTTTAIDNIAKNIIDKEDLEEAEVERKENKNEETSLQKMDTDAVAGADGETAKVIADAITSTIDAIKKDEKKEEEDNGKEKVIASDVKTDSASVSLAASTTTAASDLAASSKTIDKVKSIISEWADDDDEDVVDHDDATAEEL